MTHFFAPKPPPAADAMRTNSSSAWSDPRPPEQSLRGAHGGVFAERRVNQAATQSKQPRRRKGAHKQHKALATTQGPRQGQAPQGAPQEPAKRAYRCGKCGMPKKGQFPCVADQ